MSATLQPDGPQITIQFLERRGTAHLQIQPELPSIGILNAQMVQRLCFAALAVRFCNDRLALRARLQMAGHARLIRLMPAIAALGFGLFAMWHYISLRVLL